MSHLNLSIICRALVLLSLSLLGSVSLASDFVLRQADGNQRSALMLASKAEIEINGLISFTRLRQRFVNTGPNFIAGEYVFPLPETATIDQLDIRIGSRTIVGQLKEKQQAKKAFNQAKRQGKSAALMVQKRDNLFRMSVANIPAGETIEVQLSYLDKVAIDSGQYRVTLPTTLTPRFNPADSTAAHLDAIHAEQIDSSLNQGPISNVFNNPIFVRANPSRELPENPIDIRVYLNPGFAVRAIHSDNHQIAVKAIDADAHAIVLSRGVATMDRDFVLTWQQNNPDFTPSLYREAATLSDASTINGELTEHYFMLNISPTAEHFQPSVQNKDIVFVIDTSGSMGGESIRQAKAALSKALSGLNPRDTFNIIEFNSTHRALFPSSQVVNHQTLSQAENFIGALNASGGTNMKPALIDALKTNTLEPQSIQQVLFITDGAVGNESELSQLVHQYLGDKRLFCIAIGSAPNRHLMTQLSNFGRGSAIVINQMNQVSDKIDGLFNKLNHPAMTDIGLRDHAGAIIDLQPNPIPDLYYGEPLQLLIKSQYAEGLLSLTGNIDGRQVNFDIDLAQANKASGIAKLWAREKIAGLMNKIHLRQGSSDQHRQSIIDLSLRHRVLSQYTSFIAVDPTPIRSADQKLDTAKVANLLPKGTRLPKTSLNTSALYGLSLVSLLLAFFSRQCARRQLKGLRHEKC